MFANDSMKSRKGETEVYCVQFLYMKWYDIICRYILIVKIKDINYKPQNDSKATMKIIKQGAKGIRQQKKYKCRLSDQIKKIDPILCCPQEAHFKYKIYKLVKTKCTGKTDHRNIRNLEQLY